MFALLQADLKFFFQKHLPFGTIRQMALDPDFGQPRLLSVFKGSLVLHCAGEKSLTSVHPRGWAQLPLNEEPVELGEFPGNKFWCSTEKGLKLRFFKKYESYSNGAFDFDTDARVVPAGYITWAPGVVAVGERAVHWFSGETLYRMELLEPPQMPAKPSTDSVTQANIMAAKLGKLARLGATQNQGHNHGVLYATDSKFGLTHPMGKQLKMTERSLAFVPTTLFQGPSEAIWCASTQTQELSYCHPRLGTEKDFPQVKNFKSIGDLAEGPGGKLWLTDPKGPFPRGPGQGRTAEAVRCHLPFLRRRHGAEL